MRTGGLSMGTRRGQAMTELAFGMFAFALVVSALTTFAVYIARSLRVQNSARGPAPERAEPVETGAFAAECCISHCHQRGPQPFSAGCEAVIHGFP